MTDQADMKAILSKLGIEDSNAGCSTGRTHFSNGPQISSVSPVDGKEIAKVGTATREDYQRIIDTAEKAFETWRMKPAPQRGEIVRQFGD